MFHGRAHQGEVHLDGMQLASPEHAHVEDAKAFAYVRPHDLDVARYTPGAGIDSAGRPRGIVARLERAIVVGPIARLELLPVEEAQAQGKPGKDPVIEAQIPAQAFREAGYKEGETLLVTPRRARVFVQE